MDDDVGPLRAIPALDSEPYGRNNVLILGTDVDGHTRPLGPFSTSCGAFTMDRNLRDADFSLQTSSNIGSDINMPHLSPDSSPASVVSSTMLMTPENGVSLADVEISPFLPLTESYFEDPVFGDGHCVDYTMSLDDLEDSLNPKIAGYPFLDAMPDDMARRTGDDSEIVHSTPTLLADSPILDPVPPFLSVPEFSKTHTSPQRGIVTSGNPPLVQRPPSRNRTTSPVAPTNQVQGSIDSSVTSTDGDLTAGGHSLRPSNKKLVDKSLRLRSPPPCSIPAKRRRVLETSDDGDDDDDYVPTRREGHPRVPSNSQSLLNKGGKHRGARKARSHLKPASKSRSRCPHCKASFSRAGDMDRHQKSLACPVLKQKAEANGTLDEAKWPCPICGDKLSRNDSQARHFENTHPGVDPSDYGLKLRKRDGKS
ncbi:hypothetical protein EDC04DRAFT_2640764 [Pisolithus marmoratus]|nr:hypothetical protein EDC04DRAFT_2640764 [Pisolithus marmoratus]